MNFKHLNIIWFETQCFYVNEFAPQLFSNVSFIIEWIVGAIT
jgi:hypothetical protein